MPIDDQRLELLLVSVSVVCAEQELTAIELNPNVSLGSANVAAVVGH